MESIRGQLTVRGLVIGCIGCAVITAASIYTALRMGALPWPIIFAAIISLFFLRVVSRGRATLNEANVTHTIMSSGAMVAGGLAFTIPGAWMMGLANQMAWWDLLIISLAGVAMGLICTALVRKHFIEREGLEYPIGQAAAETLKASDAGGRVGVELFGAMGFAGLYSFLRDGLGFIPAMLAQLPIPGVAFGIFNSPMMLAVGFLVGTGAVVVWFAGAVLGNFGIIVGGTAAGWFDLDTAQGIVASLGMGVMMGSGFGVIFRDIVPRGIKMVANRTGAGKGATAHPMGAMEYGFASQLNDLDDGNGAQGGNGGSGAASAPAPVPLPIVVFRALGCLLVAAIMVVLSAVLGWPAWVSIIAVLFTFITTAMAAQSVGQSGIDPMEIFGLIVLLIIAAFADVSQVTLFMIAALVAVASGLVGDVMNDFKAGHILGTSSRAQWIGQSVGGVIGAVIAVLVMQVLLAAYGADAFGPDKMFVSAQASVVATMVTGVPSFPAFVVGIIAGFLLYLMRFPAMMLGLGIYLPFYMSFTAFLGAMAKVVYDAIVKRVNRVRGMTQTGDLPLVDGIPEDEAAREASQLERTDESDGRQAKARSEEEAGLIVASGLLGGESIVGIIIAIMVAAGAFIG